LQDEQAEVLCAAMGHNETLKGLHILCWTEEDMQGNRRIPKAGGPTSARSGWAA